jgi:hypothetical protein
MGGEQRKGKEGVNSRKGFEKHYKKRDFMIRGMKEKIISRMKLSK